MIALPDRRVFIPALGITQIFAWGSTFYLPAALAPLIASDTGSPYDLTVAGVSVGLLVAGLASPRVGRLIAERGGRPVLAIGALLLGTGLLGIGTQLTARGIEMSAAVAFGAIVGPSQVGARMIELLVGNRYDPVWTIVASATLVATSALMLMFGFPIVALAIALCGAGNGIGLGRPRKRCRSHCSAPNAIRF